MRGQIVQRGRSFAAVVYLGRDSATGKERRKWTTFRTKREAERYLHQAVVQLESGGTIPTTRQRLGEYLDDWLRGHAPHLAPTTLASYRDTIRVHLAPHFGHVPLTKLQPQAIRDYIDAKLSAGLSPKTVSYHRTILRTALEQALRDGLVVRNVAALVKAPRKSRREMATLDLEQVRLFLGEARRSSPYYRLYLAALTTGARQGELLGLRWKDCDLILGRASVQQTFYRLGGSKRDGIRAQQLFKSPKTTKARRPLPLPAKLVSELLALREQQKEQKRRLGDRYHDLDLVFAQPNGKPLHAHNIARRDFRRVLKVAGLPRIRFHDLRHSVATIHLQNGTHPKVVQELLGHSTVSMTLDTYSHVVPGMQEQAAARLEARLFRKEPTASNVD